ncbi:hypothetical protein [Streptomyces sennicomposti]
MTEVDPYVEAHPYAETSPHLIDTAAAEAAEAPRHGRVSPLSHARR